MYCRVKIGATSGYGVEHDKKAGQGQKRKKDFEVDGFLIKLKL